VKKRKIFSKIKKREKRRKSEHFEAIQRKIFEFPFLNMFFNGFNKKIVDICEILLYILYYYIKVIKAALKQRQRGVA